MSTLISFRNADLGYREPVLRDVTLDICTGDYFGIVGPNGAGKTTLLKAVLGLIRPMAGSVRRPQNGSIGYVPQRDTIDTLFPLTVLDIVVMGLYHQLGPIQRPSAREKAKAMDVLSELGIAELADRPYRSLSGGQKQRCVIARALVARPEVLLLDEPTNGMDLPAEQGILALIDHLHSEHHITILLVSHMLHVVLNHVSRIAIVGEGQVSTYGVKEMMDGGHLSRIYQMPVRLLTVDGRVVAVSGTPEADCEA